jgi:hypothetical protein
MFSDDVQYVSILTIHAIADTSDFDLIVLDFTRSDLFRPKKTASDE